MKFPTIVQLGIRLKPDTIPMVLIKYDLVDEILSVPFFNETTLGIVTMDIYKLERCILTSMVVATEKGAIKILVEVLDENKIQNTEEERVMILSGGHGTKDGNLVSVGAKSFFTNYKQNCYGY